MRNLLKYINETDHELTQIYTHDGSNTVVRIDWSNDNCLVPSYGHFRGHVEIKGTLMDGLSG